MMMLPELPFDLIYGCQMNDMTTIIDNALKNGLANSLAS
jgi:hypothetical protein